MKRVRFYDDNQKYLRLDKQLMRYIETIWVSPEPMMSPNGKMLVDYIGYLKSRAAGWDLHGSDRDLGGVLNWLSEMKYVEEEIVNGLTDEHFRDLISFARALPRQRGLALARGVVIFDWDEVVNHTRGFRFRQPRTAECNSPSGYLKYVIGSKQRLDAFRKCLNVLFENQITVHIATNNTGCELDLYTAIVHELDPRIRAHCCNQYRSHMKILEKENELFASNKSFCIDLERMIPEHLRVAPTRPDCPGGFRNCVSLAS